MVQSPASVTKNEYDPEVSPVKLTDDPNVISTWPVEALKKYGGVPFRTINSTSPSFWKQVGWFITINPPEDTGVTVLTVND